MTETVDLLKQFVLDWKDIPVVWGESDCTAYAAKWVELVTGRQVTKLASYSSREEAYSVINEFDRLSVIWDEALEKIGIFERYDEPQIGDVAIVRTADFGDIGVIVANNGACLVRTENGTRFMRPRSFIKVWAVV